MCSVQKNAWSAAVLKQIKYDTCQFEDANLLSEERSRVLVKTIFIRFKVKYMIPCIINKDHSNNSWVQLSHFKDLTEKEVKSSKGDLKMCEKEVISLIHFHVHFTVINYH